MKPATRRRVAAVHAIVFAAVALPLSMWIPTLDEAWFSG